MITSASVKKERLHQQADRPKFGETNKKNLGDLFGERSPEFIPYEKVGEITARKLDQLYQDGKWPLFKDVRLSKAQALEQSRFIGQLYEETCRELGLPWPPPDKLDKD